MVTELDSAGCGLAVALGEDRMRGLLWAEPAVFEPVPPIRRCPGWSTGWQREGSGTLTALRQTRAQVREQSRRVRQRAGGASCRIAATGIAD